MIFIRPQVPGTGNDLTANTTYTTQYLTPENKHKLNEGWESMPDPIDPSKTIIFKETDWQDVLFRTAVSHNHNVNVSGGSETATFNASAGYMKNEGTVITTYYDRLTFNLGGEVKLRPNLKIGGRASYSKYTNNGVNETSIFARAIGQAPTTKYTSKTVTPFSRYQRERKPGLIICIGIPIRIAMRISRSSSMETGRLFQA